MAEHAHTPSRSHPHVEGGVTSRRSALALLGGGAAAGGLVMGAASAAPPSLQALNPQLAGIAAALNVAEFRINTMMTEQERAELAKAPTNAIEESVCLEMERVEDLLSQASAITPAHSGDVAVMAAIGLRYLEEGYPSGDLVVFRLLRSLAAGLGGESNA